MAFNPKLRNPDDKELRALYVEYGTNKLRESGLSGSFYGAMNPDGAFRRYDIERDFQTFRLECLLFLAGFEAGIDHALNYDDHASKTQRLDALRVLFGLATDD